MRMNGEQDPTPHHWRRSRIEESIIKDNVAVPFAFKNDPSTWEDISIVGRRTQEDGIDTFMEMVGHQQLGVVGLHRFDYDPTNGIWSAFSRTAETPHADPQVHMDFGLTEGRNGVRRSLTYHYEKGEEMFVLADTPTRPDRFRLARGIYNSYGVMMGFQSDLLFPDRGLATLHVSAGAEKTYNVGLYSYKGKQLLDVKSQHNQEIDIGEATNFQLQESESGRTTIGISYRNEQGEYTGHILSYPPRVALSEYADHIRTRYCKGEDNTVVEEFPRHFHDDADPEEKTW
jgi:hypothetical protein